MSCVDDGVTVASYLRDETGAVAEQDQDKGFSSGETSHETELIIRHRKVWDITRRFGAWFLAEDANNNVGVPGLVRGVVVIGRAIPLRSTSPEDVIAAMPCVERL